MKNVHRVTPDLIHHTPHCTTVLLQGQNKTMNASPNEQSIMKYLPELSQDEPLRRCSGNQATMLLKIYYGIKCHFQYIKVIRLFQHSSANSSRALLGMNCAWPVDYHSRSLTRIQFDHSKVTILTNLAVVTVPGRINQTLKGGGVVAGKFVGAVMLSYVGHQILNLNLIYYISTLG